MLHSKWVPNVCTCNASLYLFKSLKWLACWKNSVSSLFLLFSPWVILMASLRKSKACKGDLIIIESFCYVKINSIGVISLLLTCVCFFCRPRTFDICAKAFEFCGFLCNISVKMTSALSDSPMFPSIWAYPTGSNAAVNSQTFKLKYVN